MTKTDTQTAIKSLADSVTALRDLLAHSSAVEALLIYPLIRQTRETLITLESLQAALNENA